MAASAGRPVDSPDSFHSRSGIFSQYPVQPGIDSSWGYDALLAAAYRLLGLAAIPVVLAGLKVALALVTFLLVRALRAGIRTAIGLSAVSQYVIGDLQPVPSALSILFFAVEFALLLGSRRCGEVRLLFWLGLPKMLCDVLEWSQLHHCPEIA